MKFREICPKDKSLFEKYFKNNKIHSSDFNFTNLFMWRKSYNIQFCELSGAVCVFMKYADEAKNDFWLMYPMWINTPTDLQLKDVIDRCLSVFKSENKYIKIMMNYENSVHELENLYPGRFVYFEDRDNFDYVYRTQDLIELSGKPYHSKKNHINKFEKMYDGQWTYDRLKSSDRAECMALLSKIRRGKTNISEKGKSYEYEAVNELLENAEELGVTCGCIKINGKIVAFTAGEKLGDDVLIHIEYADTDFQGLYAVINREFLLREWSDSKYVIREEDMGIEGMRKAKLSYNPVSLTKKYIAVEDSRFNSYN